MDTDHLFCDSDGDGLMFQLSISNNSTHADLLRARRALNGLAKETPHVAVRVANKSMTGAKTDMKKIIRAGYNYKASALEKRLKITRANKNNLTGYVESKGGMYHLTDVTGTRQTAKGVSVSVERATPRSVIPSAFIAHGQRSGKKIVFRRKEFDGKMVGRMPIVARSAAHPEHVYNTPKNWQKIASAIAVRINTNIKRETDAEIRRLAGKW